MAKGNLKKTVHANTVARRNLILGTLLTQLIHLCLLSFFWSAPWTRRQKSLYFLSTAAEGFILFTLFSMSAPRKDKNDNIVSAGEDLAQSGLTSYMFDVIYITWVTHVLTALISSRIWWLYATIPSYAFYKIYFMFFHQRLFGGGNPFGGMLSGGGSQEPQVQEQLSKTQAKKQARQKDGQQPVKYVRR